MTASSLEGREMVNQTRKKKPLVEKKEKRQYNKTGILSEKIINIRTGRQKNHGKWKKRAVDAAGG